MEKGREVINIEKSIFDTFRVVWLRIWLLITENNL